MADGRDVALHGVVVVSSSLQAEGYQKVRPHTMAISLAVRKSARSLLLLSASAAPGLRTNTDVCTPHHQVNAGTEISGCPFVRASHTSTAALLVCTDQKLVHWEFQQCLLQPWLRTLIAFQSVPNEQCCMMMTVR
jgi:hypothetical protein